MNESVRFAAQATVDAIDREIRELSAARETLADMFGLGVRVPKTVSECPQVAITAPIPLQTDPTPVQPVTAAVKTPATACQNGSRAVQDSERWAGLRQQVLEYLGKHGPTCRGDLRKIFDVGCRTNFKVMTHRWFSLEGRIYSLTPEGKEALAEMGVVDVQ